MEIMNYCHRWSDSTRRTGIDVKTYCHSCAGAVELKNWVSIVMKGGLAGSWYETIETGSDLEEEVSAPMSKYSHEALLLLSFWIKPPCWFFMEGIPLHFAATHI